MFELIFAYSFIALFSGVVVFGHVMLFKDVFLFLTGASANASTEPQDRPSRVATSDHNKSNRDTSDRDMRKAA
jgi:hypothetical protein